MIPRTFPSTYASNGQQQMLVHFLTDVTGLQRWSDYIPVKLAQTGTEDSYANNGYIDIAVLSPLTASTQAWKEYIPVYVDDEATDTWTVNATGYIPYGYALFGDASMQLDFTNGAALDSRITFTRSTTATRTNSSGLIESVAIDGPRFDYDPVTLAPKGLLIEEQRTNLVTYSEQFDNAAWSKSRVTITADAIVSPDGTMDADKMVDDTQTGSHTVRNATSVTITSGTTLTASVFAKAAEGAYVIVGIGDGGGVNISRATFNLSTGAVTNLTTGTANVSAPIAAITSVGNGWYRCVVTATVTGVTTAQQWVFKGSNASGAASYTGDNTSGIYIWGAQLEAGAFATSYIPTVASQVTRAADVALMTGTNFSDWYNTSGGTLLADFTWEGLRSVAGQRIIVLDDGTTTTYWGMLATGGNGMQNPVVIAGTTEATNSTPSTTYTAFTPYKQAVALALNNSVGAINGSAGTTDTAVGVPSGLTTARFAASSAAVVSNIWFRRIAYFPRRLSDAELQGLTS